MQVVDGLLHLVSGSASAAEIIDAARGLSVALGLAAFAFIQLRHRVPAAASGAGGGIGAERRALFRNDDTAGIAPAPAVAQRRAHGCGVVVVDIDHTLKSGNAPWVTPPVEGMAELLAGLVVAASPTMPRRPHSGTTAGSKQKEEEEEEEKGTDGDGGVRLVYLSNRYGPVGAAVRSWHPQHFLRLHDFPEGAVCTRGASGIAGFVARSAAHKKKVLRGVLHAERSARERRQRNDNSDDAVAPLQVLLIGDSTERDCEVYVDCCCEWGGGGAAATATPPHPPPPRMALCGVIAIRLVGPRAVDGAFNEPHRARLRQHAPGVALVTFSDGSDLRQRLRGTCWDHLV